MELCEEDDQVAFGMLGVRSGVLGSGLDGFSLDDKVRL